MAKERKIQVTYDPARKLWGIVSYEVGEGARNWTEDIQGMSREQAVQLSKDLAKSAGLVFV